MRPRVVKRRSGPVGGGMPIQALTGEITLTRVTITGDNGGEFGGGIAVWGWPTRVTISGSPITRNSADDGGGIANASRYTGLTVADSTITENTGHWGGGLANRFWGALVLINSAVSHNSAALGGGGVANDLGGTVELVRNAVVDNTAGGGSCNGDCGGGGIDNIATLTLNNSTVAGNSTVFSGGGIANSCDQSYCRALTTVSSTIPDNSADLGGGMASSCSATPCPSVNLKNTLLARNNGGDCMHSGAATFTSNGHNLDDDGTCNLTAAGDLSHVAAARLGPLAMSGGPTQTCALLPGSPAIDAGGPGGCTDASGDGTVTVDGVLTLVNIALGNEPTIYCGSGDVNGDGQITVDEILTAVNRALNGCYPTVATVRR